LLLFLNFIIAIYDDVNVYICLSLFEIFSESAAHYHGIEAPNISIKSEPPSSVCLGNVGKKGIETDD